MSKPMVVDESTLEFLWKSSLIISNIGNNNFDTIKCHLRSQIAENFKFESLILPQKLFGAKSMCQHCHSLWLDGKYSLRLKGRQPKRSQRKLLKQNPSHMSKYQKKLYALFQTPVDNILEIICKICNEVTKIKMKKPEPPQESQKADVELPVSTKKKKKKKKDHFAGLNFEAVKDIHVLNDAPKWNKFKRKRKEVDGEETENNGIKRLKEENKSNDNSKNNNNILHNNKTKQKSLSCDSGQQMNSNNNINHLDKYGKMHRATNKLVKNSTQCIQLNVHKKKSRKGHTNEKLVDKKKKKSHFADFFNSL